MFSIVALRRSAKVDVLAEEEFWKQFDHYVHRFDLINEQAKRAHGDSDLRLVENIEEVAEPILGPEGFNGEAWYQNLDFYGDGVRSLELDATRFKPEVIAPLHALLVGEHERFCILGKLFSSLGAETSERIGALALFHERILITQSLVPVLEHA
jgi:hypothetical protein